MENPNEVDKRVLTIKKTFNAPRLTVWEAWTNPDHIIQWWAPRGMEIKVISHEFKVGGRWEYSMPMADGTEFISEGVYAEIKVPERIVTSANFRPMTEGVMIHVLFEEAGDKTYFTFSVIHPSEQYCQQQERMGFYNGWGSAFTRLDSFVSSAVA